MEWEYEAKKGKLKQFIRGWVNYFKLADMKNLLKEMDEWIRSRIRMVTGNDGKGSGHDSRILRNTWNRRQKAWMWANTRKGYWRIAHSPIL